MKTIEELSLKNMVAIEKYLNDQMTDDEKLIFLKSLEKDQELREDFEMAREAYVNINLDKDFTKKYKTRKGFFELPIFSINRKRNLGNKLTQNGLIAILAAVLMFVICLAMLFILS